MRLAIHAAGIGLMTLAASLSAPALAGGIGVITTGGTHQENIFVYDDALEQMRVEQQRPSYGFGVQGLLGDRDDRIIGLAKFYFLSDSPATDDPESIRSKARSQAETDDIAIQGDLVYAVPTTDSRSMGVAMAGVQWGILPDPGALQFNAITSLGAAVLTPDSTEFVLIELGAGAQYGITETIQVNAEVAYDLRIRKDFRHGMGVNLGVRYMFD